MPTGALWRDRRFRAVILQGVTLAVFIAFIAFIVHNTAANLEQRGIASGFGFLSDPAGFDISFTLISYELSDTYGRVFLIGLLNTLLISVFGIIFATILGVIVGVLRLSGNWLIGKLVSVYIEVVRNVPLLLQILFWYSVTLALPRVRDSLDIAGIALVNNRAVYLPRLHFDEGMWIVLGAFAAGLALAWGLARWARLRHRRTGRRFPAFEAGLALVIGLPVLTILAMGAPWTTEMPQTGRFNIEGGIAIPQTFTALWLALTTYTAAFIGELVRAGIQSVDKGQIEAAKALGLKPGLTLRLIVLPQALRVIIPPTTSQYLNLTKNSSLGVVIGYPDIVATVAETTQSQTGQAIETLFMVMMFYLTVSLIISTLMNLYNKSVAIKER